MASSGYFAPFIDALGLHLPTYAQILADNLQQFQNIYGQNVYLGPDSSDYQMISALSLKQSDTMQALQLAYNARSALTAIGTDLDAIVRPIARETATFSIAAVTLTGVAGTTVTNGQIQDGSGNTWALPSPITFGGATLATTATCTVPGPITPAIAAATISSGGTAGWTGASITGVTNTGTLVESDAALRARFLLSLGITSTTRVAATYAALAALPGVTRLAIEENFTGSTDSNGCPSHSITAVVEGGVSQTIANTIYTFKTPGGLTNGTTTESVTDPVTGVVASISFDRPTYVPIFVTIVTNHLGGFVSSMLAAIQTAITTYLNSLQIGETVTYGAMWAIAMNVNANINQPNFSIASLKMGTSASPTGTTDITVSFNQVAQGIGANVVVS